MTEAAKELISQGVLGLIVVGLVWWVLRKDAECTQERKDHAAKLEARNALHAEALESMREGWMKEKDGRIEDAKGYAGMSLQLQSTVISTVNESRASDALVASEMKRNTEATTELTSFLRGAAPK